MIVRALFLLMVPTLASAESLGQITAFIDGEEKTWHLITFVQADKTIATASWRQQAHLGELQFQGHPVPEFTSKDVFSIETRFAGNYAPGDAPMSVEFLYTPNGLSGPLWTSRGAPEATRLQLIDFEIWGSVGNVVAVFSGQICEKPRLFSQVNPKRCKTVNGKIESRLAVE